MHLCEGSNFPNLTSFNDQETKQGDHHEKNDLSVYILQQPYSTHDVDKIVTEIEKNVTLSLHLEALYLELNESEDLIKVANKKEGTNGFNLVNYSVIDSLILCVFRKLDKASLNRACLATLVCFFEQNPGLVEHYANKAKLWPGNDEDNYGFVKQTLQEKLDAYKNLIQLTQFKVQLKALKEYRDYDVGHTITLKKKSVAKYQYIIDLISEIAPIVNKMYLCISGTNIDYDSTDYDSVRNIGKKDAQGFVKTLINGFK